MSVIRLLDSFFFMDDGPNGFLIALCLAECATTC